MPHQNAEELLDGKFFPDNPPFQNQKIGKSGKSSKKSGFFSSGNRGIFRPNFPKSRNFAAQFFQNQNFIQEIGKFMEMREKMEKILKMLNLEIL